MHLTMTGVNQKSAPLAVRERLALNPEKVHETLTRLGAVAAEAFVLSTCNRVEVYTLAERAVDAPIAELRGDIDPELADNYFYRRAGNDAVRHLFRVAAGLDSLVLGEDQILVQIKGALESARAAGTLGPVFYRLGNDALAAGKRVRTGTAIGRNQLSVVSVALSMAEKKLGDLSRCRILLVGAGQTAELTLKHLSGERFAPITIVNRSYERAEVLALHYGACAVQWEMLADELSSADLVISCTSAPVPVITPPMLCGATSLRTRPLLAFDLAVPRDIDTTGVEGVEAHNLSSLEAICDANRQSRVEAIGEAEVLVESSVRQFMEWWRARAVVPTVAALRSRAEAVSEAEAARTLARLPDLQPNEREAVRYMATAIANKLLHDPIVELKKGSDGAELAETVQRLFRLPVADEAEIRLGSRGTAVSAQPASAPYPTCFGICYPVCIAQCPALPTTNMARIRE